MEYEELSDPYLRGLNYIQEPQLAVSDYEWLVWEFKRLFVFERRVTSLGSTHICRLQDDAQEAAVDHLAEWIGTFRRAVGFAREKRPECFGSFDVDALEVWEKFVDGAGCLRLWQDSGQAEEVSSRISDVVPTMWRVFSGFDRLSDAMTFDSVFSQALTPSDGEGGSSDTPGNEGELLDTTDGEGVLSGTLETENAAVIDPIAEAAAIDASSQPDDPDGFTTPLTWTDDDRDAIRDKLSGQQLKLFDVLWKWNSASPGRWKSYDDLKTLRAEKVWRRQPDSTDIKDSTVFEALRKLQKALTQQGSSYMLTIEHEARRVQTQR